MTKKEAVETMKVLMIIIITVAAFVVAPPLISAPSNLSVMMGFGVLISAAITVSVIGFGRANKLFEEAYDTIRDAFFT